MRGLKHAWASLSRRRRSVAPYVGAWIETDYRTGKIFGISVAPYVGAWIETQDDIDYAIEMGVAPYVGAWIETIMILPSLSKIA